MSDDDSMGADSETSVDSWETWNSFRLLCEHHSQLSIALDIVSTLPSANSLGRWFGEPVRSAIISTDSLIRLEGWEDTVTIVSSDMRHWNDPEKADILQARMHLTPVLDD